MVTKATLPATAEEQAIAAEIEAARAEYKKASDKFQRRFNVLSAKIKAARENIPLTLASALVVYTEVGEHTEGYQWLHNRAWKGDWQDSCVTFLGSHWPETNQRCLKIMVPRRDNDAKIAATLALMPEILDAVLPGALVDGGKKPEYEEYRVFEIFHSGSSEGYSGTYYLLEREGRWGVVNPYLYRYESRNGKIHWVVGDLDLESALRWIGKNLPYGDDYESEDDDGE